jgi:hypothetical protein
VFLFGENSVKVVFQYIYIAPHDDIAEQRELGEFRRKGDISTLVNDIKNHF